MTPRTWIILGATSVIAEQFAHIAAKNGHSLLLVGRNKDQLEINLEDIKLRYHVPCEMRVMDIIQPEDALLSLLQGSEQEIDIFIAHADFTDNAHLNNESIHKLVTTNILSTTLLINAYLKIKQQQHNLIFLSSVAACRGRAKNSLYGASKAAIEVYLEGLQQVAAKNKRITIARLGFIDTHQTYGVPGIFYAAPPAACAKACWKALHKNKHRIYYPGFWRLIMLVITSLPFFMYKKMGKI